VNKFFAVLLSTLMVFNVLADTGKTQFPTDALQFGRVSNANKTLIFKRNSATPPGLKWNESASAMQFTNDGTNYFNLPSGSINVSTRSATTTDNISNTDDVVFFSGASFAATINFSAVGNNGKVLTLVHNGTSLTQVYTLNTTSSQTIGGIASGVYKLFTNGERLRIVSDNANWQILDHKTLTTEADAGALWISKSSASSYTIASASITAGTTYTSANGCTHIVSTTTVASTNLLTYSTCAPDAATATLTYVSGPTAGNRSYTAISTAGAAVKAATPTFDRFIWARDGAFINWRWEFNSANNATTGTGDDLVFFADRTSSR